MLKKYKNEFVEKVKNLNIPKDLYKISFSDDIDYVETDDVRSVITFQIIDSNLFFKIRSSQYSFHEFDIIYMPFSPEGVEINFPLNEWTTFEKCLSVMDNWIEKHVDEYLYEKKQPDLLEILTRQQFQSLHSVNFDNNIPFTSEEKKQVRAGLEEAKLLLPDLGFTSSQLDVISKRLDHLAEATERLNKVDWKEILISSLISLIMTLALDTEKSQKLITLFSNVFSSLFRIEF